MRSDTVLFIITHQRAEKQLTLEMLKKAKYKGEVRLVVDDKDNEINKYRKKYGEILLEFNKQELAKNADTHINKFPMGSALFARNVCSLFAQKLGAKYYFICDDDIKCIKYKDSRGNKLQTSTVKDVDSVLEAFVNYMDKTTICSLGVPPDGAYIGGINDTVRKGVKWDIANLALCRTDNPVSYKSIMWEDMATLTRDLQVGKIEFSPMLLSQVTPENGAMTGGCKSMYENTSDYSNAFMVLMARPDSVVIKNKEGAYVMRVNKAVLHPYILGEEYKKAAQYEK